MAGNNPAADATGGTQQVDTAALTAAVNQALGTALKPITDAITTLTQGQKSLSETIAAQTTAAPTAGKKDEAAADGGKPLTADDVNRIVKDSITQALTAQNQTQQQQQQRQQFVSTRLKNFPDVYQARLGNDPAKWEDEAKAIAEGFKADSTKFGWKTPSVGGDNPGGASPAAAAPDLSKMSPVQLAEMSLKSSKPVGSNAVTTTGATATAAAGA